MKKQEIENELVRANQHVDEALDHIERLLIALDEDGHNEELIEEVEEIEHNLQNLQHLLVNAWNKED